MVTFFLLYVAVFLFKQYTTELENVVYFYKNKLIILRQTSIAKKKEPAHDI